MTETMTLAEAASVTATGDVWLFRGRSTADKAIRLFTNSPVNHVSVVLAIEDLPPLLWHAELGLSLTDVWSGTRHRGAQLHRLEHAVSTWVHTYGQRAWLRQIDLTATADMEDAFLETVDELSGRPFPRAGSLAKRWLLGRVRRPVPIEDLFCAEVVATTYERMGLLESTRPLNWYDPGRFWSGDRLDLVGATLGHEIEITDIPLPPAEEMR